MATNGIFGKYVIKKMEKQARKVSFWVNEPFETKGFWDTSEVSRQTFSFGLRGHSKKYKSFWKSRFPPRAIRILSAEIQIYSDDQCAAVKSFEKNLKKMS